MCLTEQSLPWLLAKLPDMLCRATDETATLIHSYISTVITVIEPEFSARATVFILVATFTQKFRYASQKTLWWELQQAIEAGEVWQTLRGMGSPRQILFRLVYGSRPQRSGHIGARTR
jgi:hypothetical protein